MRSFLVLVPCLLLASVPTAAADVNLCQRTTGVCVFSWSWDAGEGSCEQGANDWYSFRVFRVSQDDGDTDRELEVENDCSASTREAGDTERSSLHVRYTSYNRTEREYSWIWLDWSGSDTPTGSTCETQLWTHNVDPLPEGVTEEGCPTGRPPPRAITLP